MARWIEAAGVLLNLDLVETIEHERPEDAHPIDPCDWLATTASGETLRFTATPAQLLGWLQSSEPIVGRVKCLESLTDHVRVAVDKRGHVNSAARRQRRTP